MPRSLVRLLDPAAALSLERRWTPDDARSVLARLEASGLTIREFADVEGLDCQRLYRWRMILSGFGSRLGGYKIPETTWKRRHIEGDAGIAASFAWKLSA